MPEFDWDLFADLPVVGILRGYPAELLRGLVPTLREAGLTCLEVTMNTDGAPALIRLVRELSEGGMNVGAGTVTTRDELASALEAGASFIVTPVVDVEIIAACRDRNVPVMAGAFTPTEVFQAWRAGADLVKLFPASHLGPTYVKDLLAPLDQVKLLAVGGVTLASFPEYLAAGAVGAGVGSPLFQRARVAARDWPWVTAQVQGFKRLWDEHRDRPE